jgi:hypothetical protein
VLFASLTTFTGGCALVSGLSDLDVGSTPVVDASVDVVDAAADALSDKNVVPFDAAPPPVDASKDVVDAASTCAVTGTDPTPFPSQCSTGTAALQAGTIPSSTYYLASVREFPPDCTGYVAKTVTGSLYITSVGSTYAIQERLSINGVVTSRYYTATVSGTTMTVALVCGPPIPSTQWALFVSNQGGKTQLVVLKPTQPYDQRFFWQQ